ncbi:hypothetical protein CFBP2118_05035 [Pseudomonas syringae pv. syringae]|nr:hypothetical protein CFBP2118_05035 [Pseudomonas syringae pv. syringae]
MNADGDNQAVERSALAVLTQQLQKSAPFAGFFLIVHVATGRVQQHGFRTEEPVTIARATQPGHACAFAFCVGEVEARLIEHGAFARCGLTDHQIPGQGIERVLGVAAVRFVALQALEALQQALAQQADLFTVRRAGVEHRLIGVVTQQAFQVLVL